MKIPANDAELDHLLSQPTPEACDSLARLSGDVIILGAGGKMGPTLACMARRALDAAGHAHRAVHAVSRYSSPQTMERLRAAGVNPIRCDLLNRTEVAALPEAENVIFMAGHKFGTAESPALTWMMNCVLPDITAARYPASRTVVFSTGCVYPLTPAHSQGSTEKDALGGPGEYAATCIGRERVYTHHAEANGTPVLMYRLSYAIDLRYGVLHDVATRVAAGLPVDVTMGHANVIWQGDANARALQCLEHTSCPANALNVTGLEKISIRWLAEQFARRMGKTAEITGQEADTAWLFDASRSYEWFGPPKVSVDNMLDATAAWVMAGGGSLGKPTHFESRDGNF